MKQQFEMKPFCLGLNMQKKRILLEKYNFTGKI